MRMATDSERIDFLGGQVLALAHFMAVLINTHPHQASLREHFAIAKQVGLAKTEGQLVADAFLEGMNDINDQIEKSLGDQ
jgi:hypothetical protein